MDIGHPFSLLRRSMAAVAAATLFGIPAAGAMDSWPPAEQILRDAPPPCPSPNPPCISYVAEARYRTGYDHLVHIANACEADAECTVSTDVSPNTVEVMVKSGTTETVITARRARTSEFVPSVECSLIC